MKNCLLAIDQGTSATKCVLVDDHGHIVAKSAVPLGERYPQPGWVEQDAEEIWTSVQTAVRDCLARNDGVRVIGVGLSTQRESAVIWDRRTGQALTPVLSWQDRRTVALSDRIGHGAGVEAYVRERSGLPLDPMFSALKICWLLDGIDPDRRRSRAGQLVAGTIDAYLLHRLGAEAAIEVGNASRTQLLDVHTFQWDDGLLELFNIPRAALPRIAASVGRLADAGRLHPSLAAVPVAGVMADSHAALFAHGAFQPGEVKATMGTGSSVMGLAPRNAPMHQGLCLTVAWDAGQGPAQALEGNIRSAGATLRWIGELFGIGSDEAAQIAAHTSSDGIMLVPGFSGLGAPWWDAHAVGLLAGLTLKTTRNELFAAALESIAHQVADVLAAMDASGVRVSRLLVDGGPSRNAHLRQLLSGFIGRPVVHCTDPELSALGVAHLAGLGTGLWSWDDLHSLPRAQQASDVPPASEDVASQRRRWLHAVERARLRDPR
ncbi:FGGY family carbohydrate kinase [Paracidovorax wautersii]|uniref:Glycerol kinase n=1 Tax=Paracidovorax wautersii TaxID=1177982 RepID=A0A1I2G4P6_9BURK|nr:FGGY family carbohydrate kinase [Paracidovorax wautersii]SFF12615.1 glycerol kinase [Paracidovorax wautersii]